MSIIADSVWLEKINDKSIVIEPFDRKSLGCNSYDVHLGKKLAVYKSKVLDAKKENQVVIFDIPEDGFILEPGKFYLGVTEEYTEFTDTVPELDGKSSTGRLGIDIHATAGMGDVGFKGTWTLEISCKVPVKVYAGMPIGQILATLVHGDVLEKYGDKKEQKYQNQRDLPVPSKMHLNF